MSQIFAGKKDLSLELAEKLAHLLALSDTETDYFLLLVQKARAGTHSLQQHWSKRITEAQNRSRVVAERLQVKKEIDDLAKGIFYSSWLYSAIRNLTALDEPVTTEWLAQRLQIPRETAQEAVQFLVENGLCVNEDGRLKIGPQRTHVPASSPLVQKHHQNWRLQGFNKMTYRRDHDLFFTFPMSLSEKDAQKVRDLLVQAIEKIHAVVGPSPSEVVRCVNLDFFEY